MHPFSSIELNVPHVPGTCITIIIIKTMVLWPFHLAIPFFRGKKYTVDLRLTFLKTFEGFLIQWLQILLYCLHNGLIFGIKK